VYTQCEKCETVFKLSAEVLRAAGGQVRCGRCGEVFNALARLAEEESAFPRGESPLEMETRADEILHSTVPAAREPPPVAQPSEEGELGGTDIELARLQVLDLYEDEAPATAAVKETSMEFTLPPGELDRIFVERKLQVAAAPGAPLAGSAQAEALGAADPHDEPVDAAHFVEAAISPSAHRVTGFLVPEDVQRAMLAGASEGATEAAIEEITASSRRRLPFAAWLAAAFLLAALLVGQWFNENREWFSARVTAVRFGLAAAHPATLSAYQLRQWGITGEPGATGTLRVRASILNTAAQLQPYPLLRVTLDNRFGRRIGARDFEPAEYLGKPTVRMLAPGERADATLDILDPGKDAEGFEIDVCLRGADQRIACAGDAAPPSKTEVHP
jgi:predicted Zn finger-like uncharacterized protein